MRASAPLTRDLLLIGGGHAHAILLRMWGMNPLPGVRLTLVNPGPTAPYTGMLPGFVAGHYGQSDLEIDLVRLARFASARLVLDQVTGLDLSHSRAQLSARPDIAFDLVSLDIGVTSSVSPPIPGQSQLFPVKPLGAFTEAWDRFLAAVHEGEKAPRVAVVGAGLGGVELAMAMAWPRRVNIASTRARAARPSASRASPRNPEVPLISALRRTSPSMPANPWLAMLKPEE
jgi:selenide,water dikinase